MLDSFRNFTKSVYGKIVVFIVLGIIGLAFALGDVTGLRGTGGGKGATLATVGRHTITEGEVMKRLQVLLRDQNSRGGPPMTMEQLIQRGGFEYVLDELIAVHSIEEFAKRTGIVVDRKTIDEVIANDPRFQGIDGKFSQPAFDGYLQRAGTNVRDYRDDVSTERYLRLVLPNPAIRTGVSDSMVAPYASLLLERRTGLVTLIRPQDMDAGPDPDDKALTAFYTRNKARYQVPERRIMRYAIVQPDQFKAETAATEDEIAKAFAGAGARFAATEKRTLNQVVLMDEATANKVAAEVKGGKSIADAAKAAGLEPRKFEGVEKVELETESPGVSNAAFAAEKGVVVGPVRTAIGWVVLRVDSIEKIPARTLDQARGELAGEIGQRKLAEKLAEHRQKIEDSIGNGGTFDEVAAQHKLNGQRSPGLMADGFDPDNRPTGKDAKPDPTLAAIAAAGFQFDPESQEPVVIAINQEGAFAVVMLEKIVPAAPRPLEAIRANVLADYKLDEQLRKARKAATDLRAEINKGTPMREALAKLGIRSLPPEAFSAVRGDLKPDDAAHVRMAFSMAPKSAKMVEGPERSGYYVVFVDTVIQSDGHGNAEAMQKARDGFFPAARQEMAEQFVEGIKRDVGVKRNEANIARFRAGLTRTGGQ